MMVNRDLVGKRKRLRIFEGQGNLKAQMGAELGYVAAELLHLTAGTGRTSLQST
jgi:hypothetical protein